MNSVFYVAKFKIDFWEHFYYICCIFATLLMKSEAKWNKSFASVNAISMSPLKGKTLICPLVLFSADSFFTSDNSCACVKDMHPYVQQLSKLWTKWSHLPLPTPLQLCLSEALLSILSVCKLFELGRFCLLAWCLWDPSVQHVQPGWSAWFPAMAPRGSRTTAVQWHLAHISQTCGRWIQDSASLWRAFPTAVGWMDRV